MSPAIRERTVTFTADRHQRERRQVDRHRHAVGGKISPERYPCGQARQPVLVVIVHGAGDLRDRRKIGNRRHVQRCTMLLAV
jgi:hypothetical protein